MAKKPTPKPIFPLKHEFYESLDHLLHQVIMLHQAVDQALDLGAVAPGPVADLLKERTEAVCKAISSDHD